MPFENIIYTENYYLLMIFLLPVQASIAYTIAAWTKPPLEFIQVYRAVSCVCVCVGVCVCVYSVCVYVCVCVCV